VVVFPAVVRRKAAYSTALYGGLAGPDSEDQLRGAWG
jgi:hypothetical protein